MIMNKYFDINEQGFSIRCKLYYHKDLHDHRNVVVATYGFGGNKDNKAVEKFAEHICNYSSSVGAYVTLRLLHEREANPFDRIAFRCPAIKMYDAMAQNMTEDDWNKLNKGKEILRKHSSPYRLFCIFAYKRCIYTRI